MTILPWRERTEEEASLFNPAFGSLLIRYAAQDYRKTEKHKLPLPFPLAFLVLPIVLHAPTRKALPSTTATLMTAWVLDNPGPLAGFAERAVQFRDITREAVLFGSGHGLLAFEGSGVVVGKQRLSGDPFKLATNTEEVRACFDASRFLGRWLASGGTVATVMSIWGVTP